MMKVKMIDRFGAPTTRKVKTKMLCQTTDPEEKRTIIGDTFMNVCITYSLASVAENILYHIDCMMHYVVCGYISVHATATDYPIA